jgi:hypothetical protein
MHLPTQLAKHIRDAYFGGNWTSVNVKDTLTGITWQQATRQVHGFNSIATLVFHTNYFVDVVLKVLEGGPLVGNDKFSFDLPPIQSAEDWEKLLDKTWTEAEKFASLVEQLPESIFWEDFSENKYGNYYRNLNGIVEHLHYHLGQMVLIKKLLLQEEGN